MGVKSINLTGRNRRNLRERFAKIGLEGFLDHEVLELLLSYSMPRRNTQALSLSLLGHYGNFQNIVDAPLVELVSYPGMNGHSAILLKFFKEGSNFYLEKKIIKQNAITSWMDIIIYCRTSMEGLKEENVKVIYLDNRSTVLEIETVYIGAIDHVILSIRELIKKALMINAHGMVLIHNHPAGDPTPSKQDIEVTRELINATRSVDIEVKDHLIIGTNKYYSFYDTGLLFKLTN